jgi:hypothetical protein
MSKVEIIADGSCLGNPGPGGWACILRCGDDERVLQGGSGRGVPGDAPPSFIKVLRRERLYRAACGSPQIQKVNHTLSSTYSQWGRSRSLI